MIPRKRATDSTFFVQYAFSVAKITGETIDGVVYTLLGPLGPLGVKLTTAGAEIRADGDGAAGTGAKGPGDATTGDGERTTGAGELGVVARGGWEKALAPGDCGGGAPIS